MHASELIIPRNGSGKPDWMGFIRAWWPIVLVALTMAWYLGGRLQTPEQKRQATLNTIEPLSTRVAAIENRLSFFESSGGHPVMAKRVDVLESRIEAIDAKLDAIIGLLVSGSQSPRPQEDT